MPTYEYICGTCTHEFEAFQRMSEPALTDCPECGETALRRKIGTGAGFIFKGTGFYETDFKDKKGSKDDGAPAKKDEAAAKPAAADAGPAPKSDAAPSKKPETAAAAAT